VPSTWLAGVITGALGVLVLAFAYVQIWKVRYTRGVRQDAVLRSQAVTSGKVFEQIVPHLPEFSYNPRDARFIGSPVDFVVFDGLSDGGLCRVIFVEVKTGGSELSARERRVRDAVKAGRVDWNELRVSVGA
jgi:predicted Holliday junction resolvase-like endonuclease